MSKRRKKSHIRIGDGDGKLKSVSFFFVNCNMCVIWRSMWRVNGEKKQDNTRHVDLLEQVTAKCCESDRAPTK